jgi:hypothetical protein
MRMSSRSLALIGGLITAAPGLPAQAPLRPQPDLGAVIMNPSARSTAPRSGELSPFWQSSAPLEMALTVNFPKLSENCLGRRTIAYGSCQEKLDAAPWEGARVAYTDNGTTVTLPARVRVRGVSRLRMCDLAPPLWVDFKTADTKQRIFHGVNRFKLVMPCKAEPDFERYVIEEYNLYRLHSLLTPASYLTRLIHLTVVDSASTTRRFTRYAFAVEDVQELAKRIGGKRITLAPKTADNLDLHQAALIGVLQYMIGNTDYSIYALHNAELVGVKGVVYPVANDFDQAGVIAAPYATPDPRLGIKSVTERLYRGLCVPPDTIARVLAELREKRPLITALYSDAVGTLIGARGTGESVRWFDSFYADMSDPRTVKSEILDKCRPAR